MEESAHGYFKPYWTDLNTMQRFYDEGEYKAHMAQYNVPKEKRKNDMKKCNCLDGAYESCDICSPPMEPGWLMRQMKEVLRDTNAVGGSWDPGSMIAHAYKQQAKIRKLQKEIRELKKQKGLGDANNRKSRSR